MVIMNFVLNRRQGTVLRIYAVGNLKYFQEIGEVFNLPSVFLFDNKRLTGY
jgi:hypothetical protein